MGQWDLPKGKLEKGEDLSQCALREVEEECGLSGITLGEKLCETVHRYAVDGSNYVKTTHWFRMKVEGRPELSPQREEGIEAVQWMLEPQWRQAAMNTYPTIQEVVRTAAGTNKR